MNYLFNKVTVIWIGWFSIIAYASADCPAAPVAPKVKHTACAILKPTTRQDGTKLTASEVDHYLVTINGVPLPAVDGSATEYVYTVPRGATLAKNSTWTAEAFAKNNPDAGLPATFLLKTEIKGERCIGGYSANAQGVTSCKKGFN